MQSHSSKREPTPETTIATQEVQYVAKTIRARLQLYPCNILHPGPKDPNTLEQCKMVVFVADDFWVLGPRIPDLAIEICPPQETAQMLTKVIEKKA